MSSEFAVELKDVSKVFEVYASPIDRLKQVLLPWRKYHSSVEALKDVNLTVKRGETFGLVGKNGSGKSTLLEIVAGVLPASTGQVEVDGRVSALLQLGAGFNPEYTGRQNVEVSAAIHGMSSAEISKALPAIIDFADIGDFIDKPVKTYSSGMFVRLAFAVAIYSEPEILIVDEALAVGDELFQRKCFSRIEQIKESGATILFVSHGLGTVTEICDRAALIDGGQLLLVDEPKTVADYYMKLLYSSEEKRGDIRNQLMAGDLVTMRQGDDSSDSGVKVLLSETDGDEYYDEGLIPESTVEYGLQGAKISNVRITRLGDESKINVLIPGKTYSYKYDVEFLDPSIGVHFGMFIRSISGVELSGLGSHSKGKSLDKVDAGSKLSIEFQFKNLFTPGIYLMNAGCSGFVGEGETFLHRIIDVYAFRVDYTKTDRRWAGYLDIASEPAFKMMS